MFSDHQGRKHAYFCFLAELLLRLTLQYSKNKNLFWSDYYDK